MDRFEFGALVASLREDMRWTQSELAERSGVDVAAISNIERGARRNLLKDNVLVKLADALRLTTFERQEFLFSASGVGYADMLRNGLGTAKLEFDPGSFIESMGEAIGRITLPVLVTDAFCDMLLVNRSLFEFYHAPQALLETARGGVSGFNQMRYVFHKDSNFRDLIGHERWDHFALLNARYFRRRTLRVRSHPYFAALLNELLDEKTYPSFQACWRRMVFESRDEYHVTLGTREGEGDRDFVALESLLALTPYGDLYLQQLLPLNKSSAENMHAIAEKAGEGYIALAPFPDKRKWG